MQYRVKNWRRFQHYKDRNPPWIKLHWELLSSMDWVSLDDASRVLAVACMLVASRFGGEIRADEAGKKYLKRVAHLNKEPNFKPLIEVGFLECSSTMLANCKQDARTETETEKENTHAEDEKPSVKVSWSESGFVIPSAFETAVKTAHPGRDFAAEVAKAHAWLLANPAQRKKQYGKFLNGWMSRAKPQHVDDKFAGAL